VQTNKKKELAVPPSSPRRGDSPFVNELLQRGAFGHQLRTLAPQGHEGQDGQQVVGAADGEEEEGGESARKNRST